MVKSLLPITPMIIEYYNNIFICIYIYPIATTQYATLEHYEEGMLATLKTQNMWANTPVPVRGEVVRQIGDAFRLHK